jgi:Fic family protein
MQTSLRSFKWSFFDRKLDVLPASTWVALGEASCRSQQISNAILPPKEGALLAYVNLLSGVVSSAALEGNPLGEDQLDRLLEGSIILPPSQVLAGRELVSLIRAARWTEAHLKPGEPEVSAWLLQAIRNELTKDLPPPVAGSSATFRDQPSELVGAAPHQAVAHWAERCEEWLGNLGILNSDLAHLDDPLPRHLMRAILAQTYYLALQPYPDGNGFVARLLGFQALVAGGFPAVAAHRLSVHANAARSLHDRLLAKALASSEGLATYVAYLVEGFTAQLQQLSDEVQRLQNEMLVPAGIALQVDPDHSVAGRRQLHLAKALTAHGEPISTTQVLRLDAQLALLYSRLSPKTLQRDLEQLARLKLVRRAGRRLTPLPHPIRPFSSARNP